MTRTVLRGAYALRGASLGFERRPLDVLIEGERIAAIEPANAVQSADQVMIFTRLLNDKSEFPLASSVRGDVPKELDQIIARALALDPLVRFDDGAWYCPDHALLVTAKTLVTLYGVEGDADWSTICELIAETLPDVIRKVEEPKGYPRRLDPTLS